MDRRQINRITTAGLVTLPLFALVDVVVLGYLRPPLADEGTGAHLFQLAIVLMAPVGLVFLATADWTEPARPVRRLIVPIVLTLLAFATLYYLEHIFYPAHYPTPAR